MRLFIAFPLELEVRNELDRVIVLLSRQINGVKWVNTENLHLTARFLGECHTDQVPKIKKLTSDAASSCLPISGLLNPNLGAFPSLIRPRAIWAGIDNLDQVMPLASNVESAICQLGFEPEKKKWSPHITLGRVRDAVQIDSRPLSNVRVTSVSTLIDRIVLFESKLGPSGPSYHPLFEAKLGAERFF